jgi:hypothetical protein
MDSESQKRKIRRFIKGAIKGSIDAFCIFQWIERCHFERWWEKGVALGSHLQPNALNKDYQKRLEFILSECRRNHDLEEKAQYASKRKDVEQIIKAGQSEHGPMKDYDFTGTTVRGFSLYGETYTAHTHKEVYIKVIELVFKQNPEEKDRILVLQGRKRKYFSRNPNDLTKYREPISGSDIYAELNENANTLYRRAKEVLQLYGMDYGSFEIVTE